jgi:hypothetical protein
MQDRESVMRLNCMYVGKKNFVFVFIVQNLRLFVLADLLTPQKFSEAMMTITTWVINMAPVGVFFLIGGQVKNKQSFIQIFRYYPSSSDYF